MKKFITLKSTQPAIFFLIIFLAGLVGNFLYDWKLDTADFGDARWGVGASCIVGVVLIWTKFNKSKPTKRIVVSLGAPALLILCYLLVGIESSLEIQVGNTNGLII